MYAFFDGDNIGPTVEKLLTKGQVREASELSENIKLALAEVEKIIEFSNEVELIILGGDDILVKYHYHSLESSKFFLEKIRERFFVLTGNTMSCGVAEDIPGAIWNLHLAKLYGKNMIKGIQ
jgi:CRISPR/Cas system-associated protein Cas10 (large subunit of type III CRISPR-Cas system)